MWRSFLLSCARRRPVLPVLLCCAAFAVTFALYGFPLRSVLYPALICAAVWLLDFLWTLRRAVRTRRLLARIAAYHAEEPAFLPPETPEEGDYQALLRLLIGEQRALREDAERRYADMTAYYTLWVHQIKTPIASMRLTLDNEDGPAAGRLRADLRRIEQYVEMVLVFLRLDSESTDYVLRECDLGGIVRGALKKYAAEFIGRGLRLDCTPLDARVLTDEKWLSFVIEQLISNALKYTPSGSIRVALEPGTVLCIADTGIGIAPEDLPRVFEKGYTGYNGRTDKRASGIGLYLCRRVCDSLGHEMTIESEVGKGTAARLRLARPALAVE